MVTDCFIFADTEPLRSQELSLLFSEAEALRLLPFIGLSLRAASHHHLYHVRVGHISLHGPLPLARCCQFLHCILAVFDDYWQIGHALISHLQITIQRPLAFFFLI